MIPSHTVHIPYVRQAVPSGRAGWCIPPDPSRRYTAGELRSLVALYRGRRDAACLRALSGYVGLSLGLIWGAADIQPLLCLASEVSETGRKCPVSVPGWVDGLISRGIDEWRADPHVADTAVVLPLLTLGMRTGDPGPEREASRIIDRCHAECLAVADGGLNAGMSLPAAIDSLHTAVTCCDYADGFDAGGMGRCWNALCASVASSGVTPDSASTVMLLEVADEIGPHTPLSPRLMEALSGILAGHSASGDILAMTRILAKARAFTS